MGLKQPVLWKITTAPEEEEVSPSGLKGSTQDHCSWIMAEHFTSGIASGVAQSPGSLATTASAFSSPPHCFAHHSHGPSPPLVFSFPPSKSCLILSSWFPDPWSARTPPHLHFPGELSLGCRSTNSLAITWRHFYASNTASLQWKIYLYIFADSPIFQGLEMEYFRCPFHSISLVPG